MNSFIKELKTYRHLLPKQAIKTLKGQALSGDLEGARKGLLTSLNKSQSNKERFTNAHRGARFITKQYDVGYNDQFAINLKSN